MAESSLTPPRPLLRRVLSFREPLLIIPYLVGFLGAAASAFFGTYSSFLHSFFTRPLLSPARCPRAHASPAAAAEEEDEALSREEVEAIMARIGVAAVGRGEGLTTAVGRGEVARLFDAEEPSFAEVRAAFAVFDADRDGFIGAADLQGALARLGVREDGAACRAMIAAAGGDGRMSLFQFVTFLEAGLCSSC
jgi:calmodulin